MVVHLIWSRIIFFAKWVGMYYNVAVGQLVGMHKYNIVYHEHPYDAHAQYRFCIV